MGRCGHVLHGVADRTDLRRGGQEENVTDPVLAAGPCGTKLHPLAALKFDRLLEPVEPGSVVVLVGHGDASHRVVDVEDDPLVVGVVVHYEAHVVPARLGCLCPHLSAAAFEAHVRKAAGGEQVDCETVQLELVVRDDNRVLGSEHAVEQIEAERRLDPEVLGVIARPHGLLAIRHGHALDQLLAGGIAHPWALPRLSGGGVAKDVEGVANALFTPAQVHIGGDEERVPSDDVRNRGPGGAVTLGVVVARGAACAHHAEHVLRARAGCVFRALAPGLLVGVGIDVEMKDGIFQARLGGKGGPPQIAVFAHVAELDGGEVLGGVVALLRPARPGLDPVLQHDLKQVG